MKKRIILIEDDQDSCLLFKHILSLAGHEVRHFFDGNNFFQSPDASAADLYILDICLPGIDGVALTKYLRTREESRHTPILVISSNHKIAGKAKNAGANIFLPKPFYLAEFSKLVAEMLNDQHSGRTEPPMMHQRSQEKY